MDEKSRMKARSQNIDLGIIQNEDKEGRKVGKKDEMKINRCSGSIQLAPAVLESLTPWTFNLDYPSFDRT